MYKTFYLFTDRIAKFDNKNAINCKTEYLGICQNVDAFIKVGSFLVLLAFLHKALKPNKQIN